MILTNENIDDVIKLWHEYYYKYFSLRVFLQLSFKEYNDFVKSATLPNRQIEILKGKR